MSLIRLIDLLAYALVRPRPQRITYLPLFDGQDVALAEFTLPLVD